MNTSITNHIFSQTNASIRTVKQGDSILFIAKDVAEALGYARPDDAIRKHCRKAITVDLREVTRQNAGVLSAGNPSAKAIPESDVYRLVMRSKLPAAEAFEDWVVEQVLPALRKTGGYVEGISNADSGVSEDAQRLLLDHFRATAIPALRELDTLNRYGNLKPEQAERVLEMVAARTHLPLDIVRKLNASGIDGLLTQVSR